MINTYKICDLLVNMDARHPVIIRRSEKYLTQPSETCDISIPYDLEALKTIHERAPHLSITDCEIIHTTNVFYRHLIKFNGFMLHSSGVVVDNKAYLFSAPSGTGKSTHTTQWLKLFGDKACIINDDKPAIRIIDDKVYVYGTPWSGKSDLNLNIRVPLQGICVLERSENNFIERLDNATAIYKIMNQTLRPPIPEIMDILLSMLDKVITDIPVWRMGCNISTDAAQVAYDAMSKPIV